LCIYANAFVAGRDKDNLVIPKNPEGLQATLDGELQPKFADEFNDVEGVFVVFHDGHCLCQFNDWSKFFRFIEKIRLENNVDKIPVMIFGTGVDYPEMQTMEVDLELDDISRKPKHGTFIFVGISVGRRLAKNLGNQVSLLLKNGKTVNGVLKDFKITEGYGEVVTKGESFYFNINEIWHVDSII